MKTIIDSIIKNRYFSYILLFVIMLIALFLRIKSINTDVWYDEVFTVITIQKDWLDMFKTITADAVHPPTYYILIKLWATIFSYSEVSLRSFSIFFGISLLPIVFYIGQILSVKGDRYNIIGLLSSLVLAVSPFFIQYSIEIRSYMFVTFLGFTLLAIFLKINKSIKIFDKTNLVYWILFIILFIFTIYTHYLNALLLTGYIIAIFLRIVDENNQWGIKHFWMYAWTIFFIACFGVIILSYKLGISEILASRSYFWMGETNLTTIFRSLGAYLFGVYSQYPGVPGIIEFNYPIKVINVSFIIFTIAIISFVSIFKDKFKDKVTINNLVSITSITLVPLIVFVITSSFGVTILIERYAIIVGGYLIIWLVYTLYQNLNMKISIFIVIYLLLLLIHPGVPSLDKYSELVGKINELSVQQNIKNIVVDGKQDFVVLKYNLGDKYTVKVLSKEHESGWALINVEDEVSNLDRCINSCIYVTENNVDESNKLQKIGDINNYIIYLIK